jgi:hypothetical protein
MYAMSPEFINGPIKESFSYGCGKTKNHVGDLLTPCNDHDHCYRCTYNRAIRKYVLNNNLLALTSWDTDVYLPISKITLIEFKKMMITIKFARHSQYLTSIRFDSELKRCINELLMHIDIEIEITKEKERALIEIVREKELVLIKDQLQTMNDRFNMLFDWINVNKLST